VQLATSHEYEHYEIFNDMAPRLRYRHAMLTRASLVWLALLALAFVNGAVRETALIPKWGDLVGHALSSFTLSIAIVVVTFFLVRWIGPTSKADAWCVGALWLALTLAFEFLAGHYIFDTSWDRLWADYNVLEGRVWTVVLIATLFAPLITARGRGLFSRSRGGNAPSAPTTSSERSRDLPGNSPIRDETGDAA
jgi:hypothetical protein